MAQRPDVPRGYLGPQPRFNEFGLSTVSHPNPEISLNSNEVEIQIRCAKPMKVTGNLINTTSLQELTEYVFTQTKEDVVSFLVTLPQTGYYKLQIYALPVTDDSKTLPGVYNYLLNCTNVSKNACPFPKQFAQWKEGCFLVEPLVLNKEKAQKNVRFRVTIPNAKSVAIVADDEWSHLDDKGAGTWEGTVDLEKHRGKADTKVTLNANYKGPDEKKFSTLLEYHV